MRRGGSQVAECQGMALRLGVARGRSVQGAVGVHGRLLTAAAVRAAALPASAERAGRGAAVGPLAAADEQVHLLSVTRVLPPLIGSATAWVSSTW